MLTLRPHHILSVAGKSAGVATSAFRETFTSIETHLAGPYGDDVPIKICFEVDDICRPCPSADGHICEYRSEIQAIDNLHADLLGLTPGLVLPFGELRRRLLRHMNDKRMDEIVKQGPQAIRAAARDALNHLREHAEPPVQR